MLKLKQRPMQRKLAVIESLPGISTEQTQQLIMATERELEMYRKSFPYLNVRWAEVEDKAKWRFTTQLFDEQPKEMR